MPVSQSQSYEEEAHAETVKKNGVELDVRSIGKQLSDEMSQSGKLILSDVANPVTGLAVVKQIKLRGENVQVNDASLDNIQTFPGQRPFINFTQSETSVAAHGRNIVAGYRLDL